MLLYSRWGFECDIADIPQSPYKHFNKLPARQQKVLNKKVVFELSTMLILCYENIIEMDFATCKKFLHIQLTLNFQCNAHCGLHKMENW